MIRFIIFIIVCCVIASFCSCSKKDYSYLNTDRRPQVIVISERYNNPPAYDNGKWKPNTVINHPLSRDIDYRAYQNLPVDTIPKDWQNASCSIDKIDSNFKIEIRKYKIQ